MVTAGYLERSVPVGNLNLSYQEWGNPDGQPIIMLHGFGVSGHMFDEFADRMQDRYRLLALDQRGHGDSDWSEEGDYSRTAFVEDLEGFRKALGIDRFVLIGHSMGGLNSVAYANAYPQHVRALVLVDVGPESAKEGVDNIMRFTRGPDELEFEEFVEIAHRFNQRRTMENIRERMRHRLKPTESGKWTWKFDKRFRQPDSGLRVGNDGNSDSWALFRGVKAPTLLIRGAESDVLPQDIAERAATEMPKARLIIVQGAGHSVPGDNPDAFTEGVREFLGDLDHGDFEAAAASAPPPLEQLVEEHSAATRRGPSVLVLVAAGAAAVIALATVAMVVGKASSRKQKRPGLRGRASSAAHRVPNLNTVDVDQARERAAEVVSRLSVVGASGARRARKSISEVDLDAARAAARDAVAILNEGSHQAAHLTHDAYERIDKKKLKKRGSRAQGVAMTVGSLALRTAFGAARRKQKPKTRRVARWRS